MRHFRHSLTFRVLLLATVMLVALGGTMLVIALRQQTDLIHEYSLSEIKGKLNPVEKKTEAIGYTVSLLIELDRVKQHYNQEGGRFSRETYERLQKNFKTYLESRSGKKISDYEMDQMLRYAASIRRAYDRIEQRNDEKSVRQELVRVRDSGRALNAKLREVFGYMESLRTAFQGLNQKTGRIQTVSLFFDAHFDTSLLEPARDIDFEIRKIESEIRELRTSDRLDRINALQDSLAVLKRRRYELSRLGSQKINTLPVGSDPAIRETLDPVRYAYYGKSPATGSYLEQYSTEGRTYLISVETLFMQPSISARAKMIQDAISGNNRAIWLKALEADKRSSEELRVVIQKIKAVYEKATDPETRELAWSGPQRETVQQLYKKYNEILESRARSLAEVAFVVEAEDRNTLQELEREAEQTAVRIEGSKSRIKELSAAIKNQDGDSANPAKETKTNKGELDPQEALEDEKHRLDQLKNMKKDLEFQIKGFYPESRKKEDAFLHLRDALLMDYGFFQYAYEPSDYVAYEGSEKNRDLLKKKWRGFRSWIQSSCSEENSCRGHSLSFIGSGGELIRPRGVIEERMWELDTTPLVDLSRRALFNKTAAFTRVFYDRSHLEEGMSKERDRLIDTALSLGIRMLFVALVISLLFVRVIKRIIHGAEKIGAGNLDVQFKYRGKDELGTLVQSLNRMITGLKHREQMVEELSAAEQIQKQLLPVEMPASLKDRMDFGNYYRASSGVGGDYYDYIEFAPGKMVFCIADVTGHGPGPAMVMAIMRSQLKALVSEGHTHPREMVAALNDRLSHETPENLFVTIFLGVYDHEKKEITYCSAGHNRALVFRYREETVEEFPGGGLPMGIESGDFFNHLLKTNTIQLKTGDLFFQFTDGLNEAQNDRGEQYGIDRLKENLRDLGRKKGERLVNRLAQTVQEFTGKQVTVSGPSDLDDDIAIIAFRPMD